MVVALAQPPRAPHGAPRLRPYQQECVDAVLADLSVVRSTVVEAATGTGKSTTGAELARLAVGNGGRVLILAPRREIVDQFAARCREFGLRTGVLRGSSDVYGDRVVVTTSQTMARRLMLFAPNYFALILQDEAHHAPAKQARGVLKHFSHAKLVGLTATPDRADGVSLGLVFERCAFRYGIAAAVQAGYLVPVRGIRVEVPGMDLSKIRRRTRETNVAPSYEVAAPKFTDLHPAELGAMVIAPECVEGVALPTMELAGQRPTVVFAVDRRHAAAIATAMNARRSGCARVVHGAMRKCDRDATLADFAAGAYQFIVNCMLLTEGWDMPRVSCVAMARPTTSRITYAQCVGRGLRLADNKEDCLLLDFVGTTEELDLVGPEDVLAGALVGPVVSHNKKRTTALVEGTYTPRGWAARFVSRVVDVMKRVAKRVSKSARRAAKTPAGKVVVAAGGFIARLGKWLVG